MTGAPVGIVTGLEAEAAIARRWRLPVRVGGGGAEGAGRAAEALAPHVRALISFGLAGGLDPALRPGDIVVPAQVMEAGQTWTCDPALAAGLGGGTGHTLLGGGTILVTPAEKRAAFTAGAHAVDLESAAVARAAGRVGIPFAVLRAVCDDAGTSLPRAALVTLDAAGRIAPLRLALAILARPLELPSLIALGHKASRARAALLRRVGQTQPAQDR